MHYHMTCTHTHKDSSRFVIPFVVYYSEPVELYQVLKQLTTRISIFLFLSHDIDEESAREISALMTAHWRGIISVPLPIRIPWSNWRLGYSKALEAKEELLKLIVEKLDSNPSK